VRIGLRFFSGGAFNSDENNYNLGTYSIDCGACGLKVGAVPGGGVIMEKYYHQLVRYLTIKLRDPNLAVDVAHDAYLRVLEGAGKGVLEFPQAYLYRTATNVMIDLHRRRMSRQTDSIEDIEVHEGKTDETPHASFYLLQQACLVDRALSELPEVCRTVFLLRKLDGMAHPEIAKRMGISKDMVEKHIVNAMKHCRVRVREMEYSKADDDDAAKRFTSVRSMSKKCSIRFRDDLN
jgi:RNA polymerase sigma factor (sigma-70 family)